MIAHEVCDLALRRPRATARDHCRHPVDLRQLVGCAVGDLEIIRQSDRNSGPAGHHRHFVRRSADSHQVGFVRCIDNRHANAVSFERVEGGADGASTLSNRVVINEANLSFRLAL